MYLHLNVVILVGERLYLFKLPHVWANVFFWHVVTTSCGPFPKILVAMGKYQMETSMRVRA